MNMKGKSFLKIEFQLLTIKQMMKIEKSPTGKHNGTNCFWQEASILIKHKECKWMRNRIFIKSPNIAHNIFINYERKSKFRMGKSGRYSLINWSWLTTSSETSCLWDRFKVIYITANNAKLRQYHKEMVHSLYLRDFLLNKYSSSILTSGLKKEGFRVDRIKETSHSLEPLILASICPRNAVL